MFLVSIINMSAQNRTHIVPIGKAIMKIDYRRTVVTDTLEPEKKNKSEIISLLISNNGSAFYSTTRRAETQMMADNFEYTLQVLKGEGKMGNLSSYETDIIYKFYNENVLIQHSRYDLTNWELKEEIIKPTWEMRDSICRILGYDCIKATCSFRGREWIVYFCPDIPINDGPWKLCGLSGLILKAHDQDYHYCYDALSVTIPENEIVELWDSNSRVAIKDRRKALQYRRKVLNKDLTSIISTWSGISIECDHKATKNRNNYDFEETDYPHE